MMTKVITESSQGQQWGFKQARLTQIKILYYEHKIQVVINLNYPLNSPLCHVNVCVCVCTKMLVAYVHLFLRFNTLTWDRRALSLPVR